MVLVIASLIVIGLLYANGIYLLEAFCINFLYKNFFQVMSTNFWNQKQIFESQSLEKVNQLKWMFILNTKQKLV